MNMKKLLCAAMAGAMTMSFASIGAFAAGINGSMMDSNAASVVSTSVVVDNEGDSVGSAWGGFGTFTFENGETISGDPVVPGKTYYIPIASTMADKYVHGGKQISVEDLTNSDFFKFDVDKDDNGKMVKKVTLIDNKKLDKLSGSRRPFLVFEMADSTTTTDIKTTGTIEFKAKANRNDVSDSKHPKSAPGSWTSGDTITLNYSLWVNNTRKTNEENPDTGDRIFFDPDKNDTNTLIWGDDRAALTFDTDDDPSKFYARLSTKTDSDLYAEYGDPVNADLWFYDFVGHPTIPSTSRATLTLGIPWDDDDDYVPDPYNCFIYERDADGYLVDVTDKFTYSEDDAEIPGWSMKTRTLGTYVISDTELDIDAYNNEEPAPTDTQIDVPAPSTDKFIPNTGSSDMVNVAVVAAVVSLAAAGAVAFRKVK